MQTLVSMIFSSETQRPSAVKEWQMPHPAVLPTSPGRLRRVTPLDAHETSYLADSASTLSFSSTVAFMAARYRFFSKNTEAPVRNFLPSIRCRCVRGE